MRNFTTIWGFELKKIFFKKLVIIVLAIHFAIIFAIIGFQYYAHNSEKVDGVGAVELDSSYEKALSGRAIDQDLLEETWEAYSKVPKNVEKYAETEEYQRYARKYSAIYRFVRESTLMSRKAAENWLPNEEELYSLRSDALERRYDESFLTEGEKEYWREKEREVEKPMVFQYTSEKWYLFTSIYTFSLLTILTVSICLASVFSEDRAYRTDKLTLSSTHGRKELFYGKFLSGLLFSIVIPTVTAIASFAFSCILYGADGLNAPMQLIMPWYSYPITTGQALIVIYVSYIFASVFTGAFTMFLSNITGSNIGSLSIVFLILLISMFVNISPEYRVLRQVFDFLPSVYLYMRTAFDVRLIGFGSAYFTSWQVAPILYILLAIICMAAGRQVYGKYILKN